MHLRRCIFKVVLKRQANSCITVLRAVLEKMTLYITITHLVQFKTNRTNQLKTQTHH